MRSPIIFRHVRNIVVSYVAEALLRIEAGMDNNVDEEDRKIDIW